MVLTYYKLNSKTASYVVTQDRYDKYYLYELNGGNLIKLKTADDPTKFKEVYPDD